MLEGWPEKIRMAQSQPTYAIRGVTYARIRFGQEDDDWGSARGPCHDCAAIEGEFHVSGCDVERCPACSGQAISCECEDNHPESDHLSVEDVVRAFPSSTLAERTGPNGTPIDPWTIASFVATGLQHPWPGFRHDPDPLRSQTIEASLDACTVCHEQRGFLAVGHPWGTEDFHTVCPWCIEGGRAHKECGAKFAADIVPRPGTQPAPEAYAEIQQRTPRFVGLQEPAWYTCCDDGMAYLGRLFGARLREAPEAVLEAARKAESLVSYDAAEREEIFADLAADAGMSLYLFQCHHCSEYHVHSDLW